MYVCVCVWTLTEDGGSIIVHSPHPAGEQLSDGWSGEAGILNWNVCWIVCLCFGVCARGSQSGFSQTLVPCPEPTHWQTSFALNSVPSAWLGDNTVVSALDGPYEGPTTSPWGPVSHPHWRRLGPWLAPHLVLWGAGVIPQELVAHLITVGNTWPFLQGEEDEEEGQKEEERGETEEGKKRKQVRKYGLVPLLMQKHNRHSLSTRAP